MTQGVYCFDKDVFRELAEVPPIDNVPFSCLTRLPEWCVYIYNTDKTAIPMVDGWFVTNDFDITTNRSGIVIVLDHNSSLSVVHIPDDGLTIKDSLWLGFNKAANWYGLDREKIDEAKDSLEHDVSIYGKMLSVALYLCSEDAEIASADGSNKKPSAPVFVKTKRGTKVFAPTNPRTWNVGFKIGAMLRTARQASNTTSEGGTHAAPRPHCRRAHWHTYWYGSRKEPGERIARVRWIHPMLVNAKSADDLIPTLYPVEDVAGMETPNDP